MTTPASPPDVRFLAARGSGFSHADAAVIGPELSRIHTVYGDEATNAKVVELAADPNNPLHGYVYRHTTREAAYRHRLTVAAQMTGAILVQYEADGEKRTTRAFQYITITEAAAEGPEEPAQTPTVRPKFRRPPRRIVTFEYVVSHQDAADEVIEQAAYALRIFQARYRGYMDTIPGFAARYGGVWREIQRLFGTRRRRRRGGGGGPPP